MVKTITINEINELIIACKVDLQEIHKEIQEKSAWCSRNKANRLRIAINDGLRMLEGLNRKEIDFASDEMEYLKNRQIIESGKATK